MKILTPIFVLITNVLTVESLSCRISEAVFTVASASSSITNNCDTPKWCKRMAILHIDKNGYGMLTRNRIQLTVNSVERANLKYDCTINNYDDAYCEKNAANSCVVMNTTTTRVGLYL
jgi:hypothetical protein